MFLIRLSVKRPLATIMFILALVIFGVIAFFNVPLDIMPQIESPHISVQTRYIGAGPQEIETAVIKPIEEQLSTINNVKNITSFAFEGIGYIIVEFDIGVDPDIASIDVQNKIDAILYKLPGGLEKPLISKHDINNQPIINLALTGPLSPEKLRLIAEKNIKERLIRICGVTHVSITGGRQREIQVNLMKARLDALNLSVKSVAAIISSQTANVPGGHVAGNRKEYTVRVQGQFENIDQIRNIGIPVNSETGEAVVPLYTIADVVDTFKEIRESARFNSQSSVGLSIYKRNDANIVNVSRAILEMVDKFNSETNDGTFLNVTQDRAKYVRNTIREMYINILLGMGLFAVVLILIPGNFKVAIAAALTVPFSVFIAFIGLQIFGLSHNLMIITGLAISIGILVTNVIIVLENIVRHRNSGIPVKEAAIMGVDEVVTAVVASVLTSFAVFLPAFYIQGITGQIFRSLGLTVVIAAVASLFLSFTLIPIIASLMLKDKNSGMGGEERVFHLLENCYISLLKCSVKYRYLIVPLMLALLIVTIFTTVPRLGMEFYPRGDEGLISINIEMPPGTSIKETDRVVLNIEKRLATIPEIHSIYSSLGGHGTNTGVNFAELTLQLKDYHKRSRTAKEIAGTIRPMLSDIPDARIMVKEVCNIGGKAGESDISVEISGDQISQILSLADSVKSLIESVSGLVDPRISWKEARPEITIIPNRQLLDEYGMNVLNMGQDIRNSLTGNEDIVFREENDEHTIRVQYAPEDRNTIDAVENISIKTAKGNIPVKVLAEMRQQAGAVNILRKNRQRLVTVTANVSSGAIATKTAELKALIEKINVPSGCSIHYGGQQEKMNEVNRILSFTMILVIVLIFMVLAGCIESILQSFLLMVTIPLGLVGVFWAMFLTGQNISMVTLISSIVIICIVVNNAILLFNYAHRKQKEGMARFDSIIDACRVKFNAILMMNLAVILAFLPLALSGSIMGKPFAVTAIGGIIVSTVMTLFVIPAMYMFTGEKQLLRTEQSTDR